MANDMLASFTASLTSDSAAAQKIDKTKGPREHATQYNQC